MSKSSCARVVACGLRRALLPLALASAFACNERPSDLRQWRVSDHDHTANPSNNQVQVDPSDAGAPAPPGLEDVTIVAWQQNCVQCHGELGRGDGPRGPMLKATNLSEPAWQNARTDEQIAAAIKLGRGQMPSFSQLPDITIAKLTKLIRMMDTGRQQAAVAAAASASASAAAVASAAPSSNGHAPAPKPSAPTALPKSSSR